MTPDQLQQVAIRVNRTEREAREVIEVFDEILSPPEESLAPLLEASAELANFVDHRSDAKRVGEWIEMARLVAKVLVHRLEARAG